MPACPEEKMAARKTPERSGLQSQSARLSERVAQAPSRLLQTISRASSPKLRAQSVNAVLPQQPQTATGEDCKNGRVPSRTSPSSSTLLPAPGDCKNGRVNPKSHHHSSRLVYRDTIAKEDSIGYPPSPVLVFPAKGEGP